MPKDSVRHADAEKLNVSAAGSPTTPRKLGRLLRKSAVISTRKPIQSIGFLLHQRGGKIERAIGPWGRVDFVRKL